MESCPFFSRTPPPTTLTSPSSFSSPRNKSFITFRFLTQPPAFSNYQTSWAALKSPRGFGPKKKKNQQQQLNNETKKIPNRYNDEEDINEEDDDDEAEEGVVPEIVTNRMMSRMGFSIGIPLFVGLLFFPFFYYLKVGLKFDVPNWIPFIFSFFFFGTALVGVSYGIVSTSWDPMREGSLLGWNEAKKNWPVFWKSLRGNRTLK